MNAMPCICYCEAFAIKAACAQPAGGCLMGQVIRLATMPLAYPDACHDLNAAECVALLACRWWVAAFRRNEDPLPCITTGLHNAGAGDAVAAFDALMSIVSRSGRGTMPIEAPRCPHLATDEAHLLYAAALVQSGESARAGQALRIALLS